MTLQFNPYPLGPWEQKQQREAPPDPQQTIFNPINQGLNSLVQLQQNRAAQQRQAMIDDYLAKKEMRDQAQFNSDYGTPIDPNAMVGMPTGNAARSTMMPAGMGQVATSSPLIEEFNKWRAGGMKPADARPDYMPALGKDERKQFYENANPKPPSIFMNPYQQASIDLKNQEIDLKRKEADNKRLEAEKMTQKAEMEQAEKARTISDKIDQALKMVGYGTAGFGGSVMGKVPGSDATNLQGTLDTIKANLGFDQLMAMRAGSKNGASGLGALSENEMRLLTSLSQSLDRSQSPEQLVKNLTELKNKYSGFQGALGFQTSRQNGQGGGGMQVGRFKVVAH